MNPINWPLIGDHPSWCNPWWCHRTALGYEHRSDATRHILDDEQWELTFYRVDEPGVGETKVSAVVTDIKTGREPVEHMLSPDSADHLAELLQERAERARAEGTAPVLEVVR
jgi:hypothetical protein